MPQADENGIWASSRHPNGNRCQHCGESAGLCALATGLERCQVCGFIFPLPRNISYNQELPPLEGLPDIAPGCVLRERYRLIGLIGQGAHGLTYFAQHEFLNHPCVVKILPHRIKDASDTAVRRLRREAQAGFRVNDPHVVRVLDCDQIEDVWYFVMEYVDGLDLAAVIQAGIQLGWQQATRLVIDAANGLSAIHRVGLIHRDIKPANLLLNITGDLRVTDLGVAGLSEQRSASARQSPHELVGTLDYAAPELIEPDAPVDIRSDLYSLGATVYHAVTGRLPHADNSLYRSLMNPQQRLARWPDDAPPDVPDWFISTVLCLLAGEPGERFASADALREHLQRPHGQTSSVAISPPAAPTLQPRGLAVLPFENEARLPADDWLGFALADSLSRELSKIPGVYVADHEQLLALLSRQEPATRKESSPALLSAGRLVGAATVVTGYFRRTGDTIDFSAEIRRQEYEDTVCIGPITGSLSKLVELQAILFEQIAGWLQITPAQPLEVTPVISALETREKLTRGKQAYLQGDYQTAINLAREVIERDPDAIEAIQYISACHARLGQYQEAAQRHRELTRLAEQRGDSQLLVEAQANMGVMYYFKGEYRTAHEHYSQAAELAEQLGLTTELAQVFNNDGFALFRLSRPHQAEEAFRRAVEIFKTFGALAALVGPYNGLGNVMVEQQRYDEARDYYRRALTLAQEIGDRTNTGVSHMHLGRCASLQGEFSDAKNEFTLALNVLEGTSFWNVLARTYEYMAEMNLRLGHFSEAIRCADRRIELARRHSNWTMEVAAWRQKAGALGNLGRSAEADDCLKQADAISQQNTAKTRLPASGNDSSNIRNGSY